MDESRRLAMRRAHARRASHCTCGKTVHGNGGRTAHSAMHKRKADGHYFMTATAYENRQRERAVMRKVPDDKVKPGMIVELKDEPGKKYEVLAVHYAEKALLRREDLDEPNSK